MAKGDLIGVEVAYALPEEQLILSIDVPEGATIADAIERSGILEKFPEIDLDAQPVGIFGNVHPADRPLQPGDRVEIYRPLIADPKQVRRERAAKKAAAEAAAKKSSADQSDNKSGA